MGRRHRRRQDRPCRSHRSCSRAGAGCSRTQYCSAVQAPGCSAAAVAGRRSSCCGGCRRSRPSLRRRCRGERGCGACTRRRWRLQRSGWCRGDVPSGTGWGWRGRARLGMSVLVYKLFKARTDGVAVGVGVLEGAQRLQRGLLESGGDCSVLGTEDGVAIGATHWAGPRSSRRWG